MSPNERALERTRLRLAATIEEAWDGGLIDVDAHRRCMDALDEIGTEELREIVRSIGAYRVQRLEVVAGGG